MNKQINNKKTKPTPQPGILSQIFQKKRRPVFYYALALFILLTFLKLTTADFFQELVEAFFAFLPMGIILYAALASYLQAKKTADPQKQHQIRFRNLKTALLLLFLTLLFYLLYSPQSFTPTLNSLRSSLHILSKENFFLLLTYFSLLTGVLALIFFIQKLRSLSFSRAFKKTLIPYFFLLTFLLAFSAFAYPGAYTPVTDSLADIIYTLSGENIKVLKPETAVYKKVGSLSQATRSLKDSFAQTQNNLTQNVQTTQKNLKQDLKNTQTDLSQNILKSNQDLQRKLSQDIEDKLDVHGATMKGDLTLEDNLKAKDTIYSRDILPEDDDSYDLGSPSRHYQNLYIQNIHGSSPITIGFHDSTHSLNQTDDLIVSGSAEIDGILHADSNINLHGNTVKNLKDPQDYQDAATKLYVDNQLGQATFFNRQDQTVLTANAGDNLDLQTGSLLTSGLQVSTSLTLPNQSITNQYLQNSQISLSLGEGLLGDSSLSLGETLSLSSALGSTVEADEIENNAITLNQIQDTLALDEELQFQLDTHHLLFNLTDSGDLKIQDEGVTEHIFTSGGQVGIGTDSPNYLLDADGTVNAQSYYLNGSPLTYADVNALPQTNPSLTTNLQTNTNYISSDGGDEGLYIDSQGNVGINNNSPKTELDIQGSVKTSFKDEECTPDLEGAQRYSPDQKAMNYCDGENWRQYNSPGCPPTVEDQDGNTYKTVQIGDQCWMAENLNVGVMVDSVDTGSTHSDVSDNGTIEKYCYDNDPANCETDGGLYDWNEAMQYTTEEGTQGICPAGWHIPTDEEWKTLEMQLGMSQTEADDTGWRGTDEGDKLKVPDKCEGGENCNASLFGGLLAGYRHREGPFYYRGALTGFWSSSEYSSSLAWRRYLIRDYTEVNRYSSYEEYGFSVRCLKD
jgi:uncharacterized protein (TIGR02145 family)